MLFPSNHTHPVAGQKGSNFHTMDEFSVLKSTIDRPICLVGMMGSGKSLVGRRLAKLLDLPLIDTDSEVEKAAGIRISEIFEIAGEAKFRALERQAINDALSSEKAILSTGGGAICVPQTADLLVENSYVIWLRAAPETLLKRIGSVSSRPLLHTENPLQTLRTLAREREAHYSRAHITVKTDRLSGQAAALAVLESLDRHLAVT